MLTIEDIRAKSDDELSDELVRLEREKMNLRFQQTGGQLENTSRVRQVRKTVAQIKSVQRERVIRSATAE
jgi:large subunit ribosomal protein L29